MMNFKYKWQHLQEILDPVLLQIGSFEVRYYGLMYVVGFITIYSLIFYRVNTESTYKTYKEHITELSSYMIAGALIGGRLGYVLFYNPIYYLYNPLESVLPFSFNNGITFTGFTGMSYHGGLIGVILFALFYVRKAGLNYREIADLYSPLIPLGYTFGRIGNFLNGELYGRITDAPIGMYFHMAPGSELRHPSQLYEALFEGVLLFLVLWMIRHKNFPKGSMLGFYLIGYGIVRFFIEYFREPDPHLGLIFISLSMGQILCITMIFAGCLYLMFLGYRDKKNI